MTKKNEILEALNFLIPVGLNSFFSDYYLILSSGNLQSLELITLSNGEMFRLLFCQKLLLKDYFVIEII